MEVGGTAGVNVDGSLVAGSGSAMAAAPVVKEEGAAGRCFLTASMREDARHRLVEVGPGRRRAVAATTTTDLVGCSPLPTTGGSEGMVDLEAAAVALQWPHKHGGQQPGGRSRRCFCHVVLAQHAVRWLLTARARVEAAMR